jgi:predicted transcriptional regulator
MGLMDNDLLSYDVDTQKFKTTEKGLRFIESYNQMVHLMDAPEFGYDSDE